MKRFLILTTCFIALLAWIGVVNAGEWKVAVIATTDEVHKAEGGAEQVGNRWVIKAGGDDIWGNADQFTFVYQEVSGDFDAGVIVHYVEKTNDWSKAGIMARESLEPGSRNVAALARGLNDLVTYQRREQTDGSSASERITPSGAEFPVAIRLTRKGTVFTGDWSNDYANDGWSGAPVTRDGVTPTPPVDLDLGDTILLGIAVTSHQAGVITTAEVEVIPGMGLTAVEPTGRLAATWGKIKAAQ